jgi:ribosomal protein L37E
MKRNRFAGSRPEKEQIGICPRCGKPVYEGQKNYIAQSGVQNLRSGKTASFDRHEEKAH